MGRRMAGRLFSLLVVLLVAAAVAFVWFERAATAPGPHEETVTVIVPKGSGLTEISARLEAGGVAESGFVVLVRARWRGEAAALRAGEYAFEPGMSVDDLLDAMVAGRTVIHRLTVAEGLSSAQVLALVAEAEALEGELPVPPEEGSLLPETYHFDRGDERSELVARMQAAMDATLADLWARRADGLPFRTPEEALVLASIVEKETAIAEERPHIAGVFLNRLARGMPLQSDPTVIFALTKGVAPLGRALTRADLDVDDPYNTYRNPGLPPGPIANPGRDAIAAVLQPLATRDLYFVADGNGGHAFAENLAEHNRNVARYRALRQQQEAEAE